MALPLQRKLFFSWLPLEERKKKHSLSFGDMVVGGMVGGMVGFKESGSQTSFWHLPEAILRRHFSK